jgi:NADH:ubiquinone oxidoreductase subunit
MSVLKKIFAWWDGATVGTLIFSKRHGSRMGEDALGNVYFEGGVTTDGRPRRWVLYKGSNDSSRVPAEWHGWLHHTTDITPDKLPPARVWQKPAEPNHTGTGSAYMPSGALDRGGVRAAATGDYEAWSPN